MAHGVHYNTATWHKQILTVNTVFTKQTKD